MFVDVELPRLRSYGTVDVWVFIRLHCENRFVIPKSRRDEMFVAPAGRNICRKARREEIERRRCGIFVIVCLQFWIGKMPLRWSLESVR